jgi:hypothetical protein
MLYREEVGWLHSSVSELSLKQDFAAKAFSMYSASTGLKFPGGIICIKKKLGGCTVQ